MGTRTSNNEVLANSLTALTTALGLPQEFGVQLSQTATLTKLHLQKTIELIS
jgi:hypothetical protein